MVKSVFVDYTGTLVADMDQIGTALDAALQGRQLQPVLLRQ